MSIVTTSGADFARAEKASSMHARVAPTMRHTCHSESAEQESISMVKTARDWVARDFSNPTYSR